MILTLIVILTIVMAPRLTLWQVHNAASDRGYQSLINAKAAILAHASSPDADVVPPMPAGRRLGQISFTPDLPAAAGATYTGFAGLAPNGNPGCATRTWVPGAALSDPTLATAATALTMRCFGRFPWLSYGLQGPSTPDDPEGTVPWMFLSANLVVGSACFLNLNPLMLSSAVIGGGCVPAGAAVPFPWLTVVDDRGNVLSKEVAIVLILPGPPVANAQQRTAPTDRSPAAYLESVTVSATCPQPCVPGIYNNAAYTVAGNLPWTFIDAPPSTALGPQPAYYQQPFTFNDRMIYITATEYFEAMEVRARGYVLSTLSTYEKTNGYLPYSGDKAVPLTTSCTLTPPSRFGLLPTGACGVAPSVALVLPFAAWYTMAGWGNYFIYAVDPSCVPSAPLPRCKLLAGQGLQLGAAATRYNAVLFSPGRAIQTVPYAVTKAGAPQAPFAFALGVSGSLSDFLDSAKNIGGPPFDAAGTAPTANYDDRMYGIQ
jgi:hypothetical protein